MQGLAATREKPPAQEQCEAMEKTMREQCKPSEVQALADLRS
jgi:hypothetical protein